MPKDEFDFEDPFELNGMAFPTPQDTAGEMASTFIEEFMRMGYAPGQILALFRNPHYLGPNLALQKHGEPFIRNLIADTFAQWGKTVAWSQPSPGEPPSGPHLAPQAAPAAEPFPALDPMGSPIPTLNP